VTDPTRPGMVRMGYRQFAERLSRPNEKHRIPIKGGLELTLRCNLNCAHCHIHLPRYDKEAQDEELMYSEICTLLDDSASAGCLWLLITGGEPLVRSDFADIYAHAKRKGFLVTLFTNGTLLTEKLADHLQEYSPHLVEITLYGVTGQTHDRVTRSAGSFQRSLRGIRLLQERHVPLGLKTTVTSVNHHEIRELERFARDLGASFRFDSVITASLDGSQEALKFRLTPEEVVDIDLADERRSAIYREFCRKSRGAPAIEGLYSCGAGLNNFHVDPYGQMSICMNARWPSYDLRRGSLQEGFHTFFPRVRSQTADQSFACGSCKLNSLCSNCPGQAYAEAGDQTAVVDYFCQIARLRARAFGLKASMKGIEPRDR